jgi:hypothetical protein
MIYLALYDNRGQCLRVAQLQTEAQSQAYLDAGFVVVDETEFNRCAALVEESDTQDLERIMGARQALFTTEQRQRPPQLDARELGRLQNRQVAQYERVTQEYIDGEITINRWERLFMDLINAGLGAASILGVGGLQYIDAVERQRIETEAQTQIGYLKRFKRDIETLSPAQTINRAKSYANATTARYWTAHTRALGLPQLPAMPGVRTTCQSNCKCNWNIIELPGNGNWDLQWRISATESCEECLMRQRTFDPLQIRNGVVQPFNPNGIYR